MIEDREITVEVSENNEIEVSVVESNTVEISMFPLSTDWEDITNKPEDLVEDYDYVHTDNNYTDIEKEKLANIEDGAEVNTVTSVNSLTGDIILSTTNINEGNNLYYTESRVNANANVSSNTTARHSHTNKSILDNITESFTTALKNAYDGAVSAISSLTASLSNKVDKITGKGLSTNDLTDALKSNYNTAYTNNHTHSNKATLDTYTQTEANLSDAVIKRHTHSNKTILDNTTASYTTVEETKLSGIAEGAEVNVNSDWNASSGDAEILNKPTALSSFSNDSNFITASSVTYENLSNNGDIGTASTQLAQGDHTHIGVYEPANLNIQSHISSTLNPHSTTASQVGAYTKDEADTLLSGKSDTSHNHALNNLSEKSYNSLTDTPTIPDKLSDLSDDTTHRLVTDTEKSTWNGKQDALGFTAENSSNKISSFQEIPDDTHYPTEKLTKDNLDLKVDKVEGKGLSTVDFTDTSYVHTDNNLTNTLKSNYDTAYSHISSTSNPHSVTKSQVGLENVPNTDCTTTANITDSTDKRFCTDANLTVISNTSGSNTGDQTITLTGDVTGSGTGLFAATIADNSVTNSKSAQMGANTYKGNATSSTANASDVSTNTAFNQNFETSTDNIKMDGIVSVGTSDNIARADHVHPSDTSKEDILTKGNLTESTSSVLTISGGNNSQIGSGTTIQVKEASTSQSGYLSNTDWNTFNGKASSGDNNDITSLSGLTTALSIVQGGTGATDASTALSNLGGIEDISGLITEGDNITISGSGTSGDPYSISGSSSINPYTYEANKIKGLKDWSSVVHDKSFIVSNTISIGSSPDRIAYIPNLQKMGVVNTNSSNVMLVDNTELVTNTIAVGSGPQGICYIPSTNEIAVTRAGANTVTFYDKTLTPTATVSANYQPYDLTYIPTIDSLAVASQGSNSVYYIRISDKTPINTISVNSQPTNLCYIPTTDLVGVTCASGNSVILINTSGTPVQTISTGNSMYGICYLPTTDEIACSNQSNSNITFYTSSGTPTRTVSLSSYCLGMCYVPSVDRLACIEYTSQNLIFMDMLGNLTNTLSLGFYSFSIQYNPIIDNLMISDRTNSKLVLAKII